MEYNAKSLTVLSNMTGESRQECQRMLTSVSMRQKAKDASSFDDLKKLVSILVNDRYPTHRHLSDDELMRLLNIANETSYVKENPNDQVPA